MTTKSITRRWMYNSLSVVIAILIVIILCFAFVIKQYYYSGVQQIINGRSSEFVNLFSDKSVCSENEFLKFTKSYIENFPDKELMEIMLVDSSGNIVTTSTGFTSAQDTKMEDLRIAKESGNNYGSCVEPTSSGEQCMAVSRTVVNSDGTFLGAVRYVVSLQEIDNRIFWLILCLFFIGAIVVLFVILSSLYFIKSIITPVAEIGSIAKRIAHGDFDAKIHKKYDDEIGELCDTINYMACELSTAEEMKNDFISSVSHELRTPLTAIKGWAETMELSEYSDRKTIEKGLKIISAESERLSGIVEELLDFSRMQNGRMVLLMDKIDIMAELDQAIYMFKDRAKSENKTLIYEESDKVIPVLGDKNRLQQVFVNIIDNALKYTQSGGEVAVKVFEEGNILNITITDNGCGISQEDLPKIKEKFYKANKMQRGSGIGLAVADEIMHLHKGSLDIKSQEGIGSVVTISIPIIQDEQKNTFNNKEE